MDASPIAELIVRNGRQQGAGRKLNEPLTIIGSTKGCDVRLNVDTVRPIHCFIILGPDGPQLRSWGADDTFVNDVPTQSRTLLDHDIVRIGPFEFDVHWTAPLAEPVDLPGVAPSNILGRVGVGFAEPTDPTVAEPINPTIPESADPDRENKIRLVEELHRQLSLARVDYRARKDQEQEELADQVRALAEMRLEIENREEYVETQRSRLLELRRRFIQRWKKHWSARQARLDRDLAQLDRERARLWTDAGELAADRRRFQAHVEVERGRLEYAWNLLYLNQSTTRDEYAGRTAELDESAKLLEAEQARITALCESAQAERMRLERHSADLRVEADGLESRVVNLRAVLLQLESQRQQLAPPPPQADSTPAPSASGFPARRDAEREQSLTRRSEELDATRLALLEQTSTLADVENRWRAEQLRVVDDLAGLIKQVSCLEAESIEERRSTVLEHDRLQAAWTEQKKLRERSEAWRARQSTIEAAWRSELARRDVDLQLRAQSLRRREEALAELFHRWSGRRRAEIEHLREQLDHCRRLRSEWAARQALLDDREQSADDRRRELESRAVIVETARRRFLISAGQPMLAQKRIERAAKRLRSAQAKMNSRLEERQRALRAERASLDVAFGRTCEQIEQAAAQQRETAERLAQVEERQLAVAAREALVAQLETTWKTHTELFDRERADLRLEIDRLAAVILDSTSTEPASTAVIGNQAQAA